MHGVGGYMSVSEQTDLDHIRQCIAVCAAARDGRGRRYPELACYRALLPGTTPTIAMLSAQAARIVGETIARRAA